MKIPSPYPTRKARIEIIPLIDVMFFLLAAFVLVSLSMTAARGLVVEAPAAGASTPIKDKSLSVGVDAEGRFYIEREPIARETLAERLRAHAASTTDASVMIHADKRARHGDVVAVLDAARASGVVRIAVETRLPGPDSP